MRGTANREKVNCHGQSHQRQEEGGGNGLSERARGTGIAVVELANQLDVAPGGGKIYDDAHGDERSAEPERDAGGWGRSSGRRRMVDDLDLLQEQAEAGHDESKTHESEAGANPGEESAFGGEVVTQVGFWHGHPVRV